MKRSVVIIQLLGGIALAACAGKSGSSSFDTPPGPQGGGDGGGVNPGNGEGGPGSLGGQGDGAVSTQCGFVDNIDHDGDGYSFQGGDCNDCDPNMNPGAYDVPKNGLDEDCSGVPDDEPINCDSSITTVDTSNAKDGAKAIGLCRTTTAAATGKQKTWGVIDAKYVQPDGQPSSSPNFALGQGLVSAFGVNTVQEGKRMLAISSGTARQPTDPGYQDVQGFDKQYTTGTPTGYPKESPACPGVTSGQPHDGAGLEVTIRVPTNAKSFSFNENFFTYEFPNFICSTYNDFFVAIMTPKIASLPDGNIAFDQQNNPISVNNSLLQVCDPQSAGGKNFPCPLGSASLSGTGFGAGTFGGSHAATGWLKTTAPVNHGDTIKIFFTIWDSGDGILDSTALVDNFQWSLDPASGASTTPQPPK